jgi:hypothetical protein
MAIVRGIKCYKPDVNTKVFHATCDTVKGQADGWAETKDDAMAELKSAVQGMDIKFPDNLQESDTGKGSWIYTVGETVPESVPAPKEEPKAEPKTAKKKTSKKKSGK